MHAVVLNAEIIIITLEIIWNEQNVYFLVAPHYYSVNKMLLDDNQKSNQHQHLHVQMDSFISYFPALEKQTKDNLFGNTEKENPVVYKDTKMTFIWKVLGVIE